MPRTSTSWRLLCTVLGLCPSSLRLLLLLGGGGGRGGKTGREGHHLRDHGLRWLGVGECEGQFEGQVTAEGRE